MWRRLLELLGACRRPLVVLDFETSGLDGAPPVEYAVAMWAPWTNEAYDDVTLAARRHAPLGLSYAATSRLNPGGPIHPGAQRVHGITAEDLRGALPYNDIGLVSVFRSLAAGDPDADGGAEGPAIFVGHNAAESDVPWAQAWGYLPTHVGGDVGQCPPMCTDENQDYDPGRPLDVLDTMRMQRRLKDSHPLPLHPDIPSMDDSMWRGQGWSSPGVGAGKCPAVGHGLEPYATSLVGLHTALFGDPPEESHGALADVLSTARCLAAMLELWAPLWPGPVVGEDPHAALDALLACLAAPPPGALSWDGWMQVDRDTGAVAWGRKARKVGEGAPLTIDRSYAQWVMSLPPAPTGRNGEAWCSDTTRAAITTALNPSKQQRSLIP